MVTVSAPPELSRDFSSPASLLTDAPYLLCVCALENMIPFSTSFSLHFLLEKYVCACLGLCRVSFQRDRAGPLDSGQKEAFVLVMP